jgi:hypothetical protein
MAGSGPREVQLRIRLRNLQALRQALRYVHISLTFEEPRTPAVAPAFARSFRPVSGPEQNSFGNSSFDPESKHVVWGVRRPNVHR